MRFGYNDVCLEHDPGHRHPESPDRLRAIRRKLADRHGTEYVHPAPADRAMVQAVHDEDYVEEVSAFCAAGGGEWDPDTIAVEATWEAALASAGIAAWVAEAALDGPGGRSTPFGIGRPPGHHAVPDDAMGFCFVNNVAVAAEHALSTRDGVDRVAIVDWDVHHGNGTQDVFYDRGDVLFVSLHERGLYPGTGATDETGEGPGEGATLNLPLPSVSGDPEYLAAVEDLVGPAVLAHDPDLLLVSAGFDAHRHDPISRMRISTEGFGVLADRLRTTAGEADAGLGFVLEGGYSLDVLADGVVTVHEVFDGYDPVESDDEVDGSVRELIADRRAHFGLE